MAVPRALGDVPGAPGRLPAATGDRRAARLWPDNGGDHQGAQQGSCREYQDNRLNA